MLSQLKDEDLEQVFVIGGASIYNQFFERDLVDRVELTLVHEEYEGDVFVQEFRDRFVPVQEEKTEKYTFLTLNRK